MQKATRHPAPFSFRLSAFSYVARCQTPLRRGPLWPASLETKAEGEINSLVFSALEQQCLRGSLECRAFQMTMAQHQSGLHCSPSIKAKRRTADNSCQDKIQ